MPPPVRQTLPFCSPTAVWSRSTPPEPFCSASRQEYGLFLLNQEAFIRRLYYKRGITKLVAPNLNFKDIIIHENDSLKCIGTITGIAHGCRWE